jgi:protein-disulfide isomerase
MKAQRAVDVLTVVTGLCALLITGLAVGRSFSATPLTPRQVPSREAVRLDNWEEIRARGHRIGAAGAPVMIVEFGDFECPMCRVFATTIKSILAAHPEDVALVYRHWPLSYHRFAYPAARAAECAAEQGRFEPYAFLLFEQQDSLGLISFVDLARRVGVVDIAAFEACRGSRDPVPAIDTDAALAKQMRFHGTPTIIINGLYLATTPDSVALEGHIREALAHSRR